MTKKLEEELNLPSLEDAIKAANKNKEEEEQHKIEEAERELEDLKQEDPETAETFVSALTKTQKLEHELADHASLGKHDEEMDDIAEEAMESYRELKDLGMNVTPAHAGKIFETATNMLKIAMEAKNSKSDKKLRMWRLQLEQARLLRDLEKDHGPEQGYIDNEDVVKIDRNKLLRTLKEELKKEDEENT